MGFVSAAAGAGAGDSLGDGEFIGEGSAVALLVTVAGLGAPVCASAVSVAPPTRRDRVGVAGAVLRFTCDGCLRLVLVCCANANVNVSVDTIARAKSVLRILISNNFPMKDVGD